MVKNTANPSVVDVSWASKVMAVEGPPIADVILVGIEEGAGVVSSDLIW